MRHAFAYARRSRSPPSTSLTITFPPSGDTISYPPYRLRSTLRFPPHSPSQSYTRNTPNSGFPHHLAGGTIVHSPPRNVPPSLRIPLHPPHLCAHRLPPAGWYSTTSHS